MSYESRGYDRPRYEGRYARAPGGGGGGRYYRDDRRNFGGRKPYQRRPSPAKDDEQEDIEGRLRSLIIKIGDRITEDLRVNLQKMKNILNNDYSKYPTTVDDTLKACITELPAKASVYGTLLGLLNISNHEAVEKLMTGFNGYLSETAQKSDWFKLKQFLRFYGELMNANVITSAVYCGLINDVLAVLDESGQPRRRLDCAAYMIMATLPWSAEELQARCPDNLRQIMSKLENYMCRRGAINSLDTLRFYRSGNYEFEQQDMLAHLWRLLQEMQSNNWKFVFLPKPYKWFEEELRTPLQHDIPRLQIPEHTEETLYISPERPFRIYVDDAGMTLPNIPSHDSLEYFILQDIGVDVMRIFEANRKECAKYLLAFLYNFAPGHFQMIKKRDDDNKMDEDIKEWTLSDLLLEIVFSQVLRLPSPPFRCVYYTCVLSELCRGDTENFPKALGRCIKTLYERLPDLDTECAYRLSCWFAHHLSNFGFQWDWAAWEDALSLEAQHPKVAFIRETLEKLIRLSYYERVKAALPQKFHVFLPAAPPGPDFEYKNPEHPLHQAAKQVVEYMRAKKQGEDLRALLETFKEDQAQKGLSEQERSKLASELFLQSMLIVGSKSFSHVLNIFERYLEVLRYLNDTPEGRLHTVQTVAKFWKNNSQFLGILLDKLLNYRVIDPNSVSAWAFEPQQLEHPERTFVWEILENILSKVVTRVSQVQEKLADARRTHEENETKRSEAPLTEMAQAEAQQELDTLRIIENTLSSVEKEQREVFVATFEKFAKVLQDAMAPFPPGTADAQLTWSYKWILGWFRSIMRMHYKECGGFLTTLETVVFTNQVDNRITSIFSDIKTFNHDLSATL